MPENSASEPFVWRPGRHGFKRLVAHVLIRLLILAPLPPHLQLAAALFPLSLAWPFVSPERPQQGHEGTGGAASAGWAASHLSEGRACICGGGRPGPRPDMFYNLSDPTDLQLLGEDYVHAPPSDLAIDPVRNLAAVSQGWKLAYIYHPDGYYQVVSSPANVNLYDVTTEPPRWVGVTSLTQGILDGMPDRVVLKGGKLYAASSKKGLQIADVNQMQANFVPEGSQGRQAMMSDLGLNGSGVGLEYVVTIPVPNDAGQPAYLNDLEVPDLNWNGTVQPLMLTVGNKLGLVVADPGTAAVVQRTALPGLKYGEAVATGTINGTSLALVGGTVQEGTGRLWVLSLAPLATGQAPTLLGMLDVPAGITDLLFLDATTVIAATDTGIAYVISLADPTNPVKTDELDGVGGRLALTDSNLLLSTSGSFIVNPNDPLRGIHATALDVVGAIAKPKPTFTRLVPGRAAAAQEETTKDIPIRVHVYPPDTEVASASLQLLNDDTPVGGPISLLMSGGTAVYNLARGFTRAAKATTSAVFEFFTSDGRRIVARKAIPAGQLILRLDSDNDTQMGGPDSPEDVRDRTEAASGKAFAFWQADRVRKDDDALIDFARISLQRTAEVDPNARVALRIQGGNWEAYRRIDAEDLRGRITVDCPEDGKLQLCNKDGVQRQLALMESTDPREVITGPGDTKEIPHDLLVMRPRTTEILFRCLSGCIGAEKIEAFEVLPTGGLNLLSEANIKFEEFRQLASMLTLRQAAPGARTWTDDHYKVASDAQDEPYWPPLASRTATAKKITLIVHGYAVSHEEFTSSRQIWKAQNTPSEFETIAKRLYWAGHPILEAQDNALVVGVSWPGDIPGDMNPFFQKIVGTDDVRPYYQEDEFSAFLAGIPLAKKLTELRSGDGRKINVLAHSLGNMVVNSALQRLVDAGSSGAPINYLMLQAAVTSEAFMQDYNPLAFQNAPGVKDLVDHAKDLGLPNPAAGRPSADMDWLEQENEVFQRLGQFAAPYTCPIDDPFPVEVNPLCFDTEIKPPWWQCDASRCDGPTRFFKGFTAVDSGLSPVPTNFSSAPYLPSYFNKRWGAFRTANGTQQGAWTALFRTNVVAPASSKIRVFNAYNPNDYVLRIDRNYHERLPILLLLAGGPLAPFFWELRSEPVHAWKALQILSKPFSPGFGVVESRVRDVIWLGGARDALDQQKWWTLEIEDRPSPWKTTAQAPAWVSRLVGPGYREWVRRRAALAMWYPALAAPAGVVPLEALASTPIAGGLDLPAQGSNIDMSTVGGEDGPNANGTPSHSYMSMKKFQDVWKGYRAFRTVFAQ